MTSPHDAELIIQSSNLVESVVARLKSQIEEGQLGPGDRLASTQTLVQTFQVSRGVVREALAKLQTLGIVEIRHGKGVYVSSAPFGVLLEMLNQLERENVPDLRPYVWEMRMIVETEVARLAAQRRKPEDLQRLADSLALMKTDIQNEGLGLEGDELFHLALTEATYNPVLVRMVLGIAAVVRESRLVSLNSLARRLTAIGEHSAILVAVDQQDADGAREAMERHLHSIKERDECDAHLEN